MKSMTLGAFAFVSALALASTPCHALNFDFSFSNTTGNTAGTVTGEIEGLVDNTANQQASAVIITSAPSVYQVPPSFTVPIGHRDAKDNHQHEINLNPDHFVGETDEKILCPTCFVRPPSALLIPTPTCGRSFTRLPWQPRTCEALS
jgi:hypothetical protein